jgi:hypothetical protein
MSVPFVVENTLAKSSKPTIQKREKEKVRAQKQRDKDARRTENKGRRALSVARGEGGEDPDLAGIVPGPQPLPPELGGPSPED